MKQSGKSIQSRSLNRVLGNIDNINVQPYEVFVEEEQKKLHEHWLVCFEVNPFSFLLSNKRTGKSSEVSYLKIESYLCRLQLVKEALPAAYANWREFHSQRQQVIKSLEQDLKSRVEFQVEVCASMIFFFIPQVVVNLQSYHCVRFNPLICNWGFRMMNIVRVRRVWSMTRKKLERKTMSLPRKMRKTMSLPRKMRKSLYHLVSHRNNSLLNRLLVAVSLYRVTPRNNSLLSRLLVVVSSTRWI